jgi:rubrerythrin
VERTQKKEKTVNIYDFAMQMEQDQENLYRELAAGTAAPGIQRILNMLADDEAKHYQIVRQLKAEAPAPEMAETGILAGAKTIFAAMQGKEFDLEGLQVEVYQQAQGLEQQSRDFYLDKASEVRDASHKALLRKLADEEQRHYFLLDHMVEFINRPRTWIEDAEFNHLQEY